MCILHNSNKATYTRSSWTGLRLIRPLESLPVLQLITRFAYQLVPSPIFHLILQRFVPYFHQAKSKE